MVCGPRKTSPATPSGAALLGGLGAVMTPAASASASGWALALVGDAVGGAATRAAPFPAPGNRQRKLSRVRLPGGGYALPGLGSRAL